MYKKSFEISFFYNIFYNLKIIKIAEKVIFKIQPYRCILKNIINIINFSISYVLFLEFFKYTIFIFYNIYFEDQK